MRTYVQPLPSVAKTKSEKEKEPAVLFFTTRWCCSALKILSSYKAWKNPSRSSWGTTEDQRLLPVTHVLDFPLLDNSVHVTIKIINSGKVSYKHVFQSPAFCTNTPVPYIQVADVCIRTCSKN